MGNNDPVAIFWDYENCAPPSGTPGYDIVNNIRQLAQNYGSVRQFKAYLGLSELASQKSLTFRSELQQCGVSLTDCPHNGRKEVADKMILDMLTFAIDTPPPATVILISGDRDFVYAVSVLRFRLYRVVVIAPLTAHFSLTSLASEARDWESEILGRSRARPAVFDSPRYNPKNTEEDIARPPMNLTSTSQLATSHHQRRSSLRDSGTLEKDHANLPSRNTSTEVAVTGRTVAQHLESGSANDITLARGLATEISSSPAMPGSEASRLRDSRLNAKLLSPLSTSTPAHEGPSVVSTVLSEQTDIGQSTEEGYYSGTPTPKASPEVFLRLKQLWSGKPLWNSLPSPKKSPGFEYEPVVRPASTEPDPTPSIILPQHPNDMTLSDEPLPITHEAVAPHHSMGVQVPTPEPGTGIVNLHPQDAQLHPVHEPIPAVVQEEDAPEPVPPGFEILVALLDHLRVQDKERPLRSYISGMLTQLDPGVYLRAQGMYGHLGITPRFSWYTSVALHKGLIDLGGKQGNADIALHPQWHGRGIALGLIHFRNGKPYITRAAADIL